MKRGQPHKRTAAQTCVALAACVLGAAPLPAQSIEAGALAFNAQHRVLFAGTVSERTGVFVGGQAAASLGPVRVRVAGFMGSLGAGADAATPETKVRSTSAALMLRVGPWAELGAEVEGRRFDADAGATVWKLYGAAVRLTPPMGGSGLRGFAEVAFFPMASSAPLGESIAPAFRGTVGVSFAPGGKIEARLGYRFERFDFAAAGSGGTARLEQFRGIVAGLGLRIGR